MIEYKQVPTDQVERLPQWVDSSDPVDIANHHRALVLIQELIELTKKLRRVNDYENI
jgi:hypothetical protein